MKTFPAEVIFLAAGGPYSQLPQGITRTGGSVLVVDFYDEGHREAAKDLHQRLRAFTELGYRIASRPKSNT